MIRFYLLITLLVCGHIALAQREYRPGYILKPSGDTLRGLVRYTENFQQALSCCYRADSKAPVTCYQPIELKGYGFATGRAYESIMFEGEPVFMQVLAGGSATLLKHQQQYYVQKGLSAPLRLESRDTLVYRSGRPYLSQNRLFVSLLGDQLMGDCPAVQPLLAKATLRDVDLIPVFEVYNLCRADAKPARVAPLAVRSKVYISAGFGATWTLSTLSLASTRLVEIDATLRSTQPITPQPALWLILNTPRISERFALQTGFSFIKEHFKYSSAVVSDNASGYRETVHKYLSLRLQSLRIPILVRYNLPGQRIMPYIAAGPSLLVALDTENTFTIERQYNQIINTYRYPFFNPTPVSLSIVGALGLKIPITGKLSGFCEGRYEYATDGIAEASTFDSEKYPHAVGLKSLSKLPYQAMQFSFGFLIR
ncbi:outer membrane beta-barrel protein [Telluribacter sp.]|jgi:hypothetical protein|uniref:outer membrane beta-barrel protein n=1 Tax=Telluribacter sp. TaxID=1978767 RepID=UPI002E166EEF|nr:outer membrane beta-barrel protein [Telluribacter sp.]